MDFNGRMRSLNVQGFASKVPLSEDRYGGDIEGDWMVQTLRGNTPGVGKVPNPNTRIDTFENRQNLTDKK